MKICGIIAEYNPLHNGHAFLIQQLRQNGATHIAVVMSGNFVQRGEAAVFSKWVRAKAALLCGADLILELPLPWAVAGAEKFALGGVSLLTELGADRIGFGSECGSVDLLNQAEDAISSPKLHDVIRDALKSGSTFASARQNAVEQLFGSQTAALLQDPNNILGIEYIKSIKRLNSPLTPFTVKRIGSRHDSMAAENQSASSTYIRSLIQKRESFLDYIPSACSELFRAEIESGRAPADISLLERGILANLRMTPKSRLSCLPDISEGLENRIYTAAQKATSLEGLYRLIKTKRYPLARIKRIILSAYLGLNASVYSGNPPYLRILGIGKGGIQILQTAKKVATVPIISRMADVSKLDDRSKRIFELENKAADVYSLCMPKAAPCGLDNKTGVIVMEPAKNI